MKFEIKSWITGKVVVTLEGENFKAAFMAAFAAGQRFEYADLSGTDLSGLNIKFGVFYGTTFYGTTFYGTKFYGTKFYGTKFYGTTFDGTTVFKKTCFAGKEIVNCQRPIFIIHPLGDAQRSLMAILTKKGIHLMTGCFSGSVDEFKAALKKKHGDNEHAQEYLAALALIELHFKLWAK